MNFKENVKDIFKSKVFSGVIVVVVILIAVGFIFEVGRSIGERKAGFSNRMGDNFRQIFDGRGGNMMGMFPPDLPGAHGSVGKIIKISLPNILVEDNGNVEKTIVINDKTVIREFRDDIKSSDLKIGELIVVLGRPDNNGQIVADLIRMMPDPTSVMGTSTNNVKNN